MFLKKNTSSVGDSGLTFVKSFYLSTKIVFLLSAFIFFAMYLSVSSGFGRGYTFPFLLYQYIIFALSFSFFLVGMIWKFLYRKVANIVIWALSLIGILVFVFLIYPFF